VGLLISLLPKQLPQQKQLPLQKQQQQKLKQQEFKQQPKRSLPSWLQPRLPVLLFPSQPSRQTT
jgi:hypothetical protein